MKTQPNAGESNSRMNITVASKALKSDELRSFHATHSPLSTNEPMPEELRLNSEE